MPIAKYQYLLREKCNDPLSAHISIPMNNNESHESRPPRHTHLSDVYSYLSPKGMNKTLPFRIPRSLPTSVRLNRTNNKLEFHGPLSDQFSLVRHDLRIRTL